MLNVKIDTLLAVAELLNYTKAAQALSLTQPAVSQHIRQLESDYGVTIFRHGERPLVLTEEGKTLVQYARKFKNLHDRMLKQLSDDQRRRNHFTIGMTTTSASSSLVCLLAQYELQAGCKRIQIHTTDTATMLDMLRNYKLDLAITEDSVPEGDLFCLPIDSDQLFAVVSPSNPLASRKVVTLDDLKRQRLILRGAPSGTRSLWENQLHSLFESIDSFNIFMELDNNETIKTLVRQDVGVSILSDRSCIKEVEANELVLLPIENKCMTREVTLVCLPEPECMAAAKGIKKMYDQQIRRQMAERRREPL